MSLITTVEFGPIVTTPYNFVPTLDVANGTKGFASATFSGVVTIAQAKSLFTLVRNPNARVTKGGVSGVQEVITTDSDVLSEFNGVYLLQTCSYVADRIGEDARFAGFALGAVLIADLP